MEQERCNTEEGLFTTLIATQMKMQMNGWADLDWQLWSVTIER